MSVKTPKTPEPPASPPPPTAIAETVKPKDKPEKATGKPKGVTSLVKRRPVVGGMGITSKQTPNY